MPILLGIFEAVKVSVVSDVTGLFPQIFYMYQIEKAEAKN